MLLALAAAIVAAGPWSITSVEPATAKDAVTKPISFVMHDCLWPGRFDVVLSIRNKQITAVRIDGSSVPRKDCYERKIIGAPLDLSDGNIMATVIISDPAAPSKFDVAEPSRVIRLGVEVTDGTSEDVAAATASLLLAADCFFSGDFRLRAKVAAGILSESNVAGRWEPKRKCYAHLLDGQPFPGPDRAIDLPFNVFDPAVRAEEMRRAEAEARIHAQNRAAMEAEAAAEAEQRAAWVAACGPKPGVEQGIRFPYGLSKRTTFGQMAGCVAGCEEISNGLVECVPSGNQDAFRISLFDADFSDVRFRFSGRDKDSRLVQVKLESVSESCDDAVKDVVAIHAVVGALFTPKGAKVVKGPKLNAPLCLDLKSERNVSVQTSTKEWIVIGDVYHEEGRFHGYIIIENRAAMAPISTKRALERRDELAEGLSKF